MPNAISLIDQEYTTEEQSRILDLFMELRKEEIQVLLRKKEVATSGTKKEIRDRVAEELHAGRVRFEELLAYVDEVSRWGKHHAFLYTGPEGRTVQEWRDAEWVRNCIDRYGLQGCFNCQSALLLPDDLTITSVVYDGQRLVVTAVLSREYRERARDSDYATETDNGDRIVYRAYKCHLGRGLVIFEWDLLANLAALQIAQLSGDDEYEEVRDQFFEKISPWLPTREFECIDLRRAIAAMHRLAEEGARETRPYSISYETPEGRRLEAKGASSADGMLGEDAIDEPMHRVREEGVARIANVYWLPGADGCPLDCEVHTYVIANKQRVNFPRQYVEEEVRYVVERLREHSAG